MLNSGQIQKKQVTEETVDSRQKEQDIGQGGTHTHTHTHMHGDTAHHS